MEGLHEDATHCNVNTMLMLGGIGIHSVDTGVGRDWVVGVERHLILRLLIVTVGL